jgi:hypothetical protein
MGRDRGEGLAVRSMEAEGAVGGPGDPVAFFVDRPVVAATQQGEVGKRRRAAGRPVGKMMGPG